MHILFVMQKQPASLAGGAQKQALMLAEGLAQAGWRVSGLSDAQPVAKKPFPGEMIALPSRTTYAAVRNARQIVATIKRLRPDVVYHRVSGPYSAAAAWGAKQVGAKFVWGIAGVTECVGHKFRVKQHDFNVKGGVRWLLDTAMDWSIVWAGQQADLIICQTASQAALVGQRWPDVARTVIANSIGARLTSPQAKTAELRHILWVGRWTAYKRPSLFLELARQLAPKGIHCSMAGVAEADVPAGERPLPPNLTLLGQLDQEALWPYYETADLLVSTSDTEGFPNIFLEAWQAGTPILSLWHDGDRILNEGPVGWYATDVADLNAKIDQLASCFEQRQAAGELARKLVAERFDLTHNVALLQKQLMELG